MEVKQAVEVAKQYIRDLFGEEGIMNVGLEEVEERGGYWSITIGFSREWDRNVGAVLSGALSRTYKTIEINDEDGQVLSVKDRKISKAS